MQLSPRARPNPAWAQPPQPGEPQERARRVPCGDPHQPPTSPRSPGGGPGPARGRRRSASCGCRCGPHGHSRPLTTQPRTRHAASARPALARAPRLPLPRPAPHERIARAAPGARCPRCPQGGLRAGPRSPQSPPCPAGGAAPLKTLTSGSRPHPGGCRRCQSRADDAEANAAGLSRAEAGWIWSSLALLHNPITLWPEVTSENHRIVWIERDLWILHSPST